jgi:hypothetical protein
MTPQAAAVEARQVFAFDFPKLRVPVDRPRADLETKVRVAPENADDLAACFDEGALVVLGFRVVRERRCRAGQETHNALSRHAGESISRVVCHWRFSPYARDASILYPFVGAPKIPPAGCRTVAASDAHRKARRPDEDAAEGG